MSRVVVIALILAFALAACGRKGDLKSPPGTETQESAEETA